MKNIKIDPMLKEMIPEYCCAALSFEMNVSDTTDALRKRMSELASDVMQRLTLETLLQEPRIAAARHGYRALGKDPSRYRLATESLLRRLIKGNGLYEVNNAVDIGNILSVHSQRSVAVLDEEKIQGDVLIRIGRDEPYEGIGRGQINISNIPVYCDEIGPFGSPTSDTLRTCIKTSTQKILLFIMSFDGLKGLEEDVELAKGLFCKYADVTDFLAEIVD
jgi:DNA/RNA-binding domain of Phe-tRNA-synthetase-like protein